MKGGGGLNSVAYWLLVIGGINWGLVGVFNWNLVEAIFGSVPVLVTIIYILVGLAALVLLFGGCHKKCK